MKSIDEESSLSSSKVKKIGEDDEILGKKIMRTNYETELQKMKQGRAKEKLSFTKRLLGLMGCCTDR